MSETLYILEDGKKRKATAEEVIELQKHEVEYAEQKRLFEAEQQVKEAARESAIAKLAALGLTEDEVKAIVGA